LMTKRDVKEDAERSVLAERQQAARIRVAAPPVACAHCGMSNPPGSNDCSYCGSPAFLSPQLADAHPGPRRRSGEGRLRKWFRN
jgi:hypothetical protein